MKLSVAEVRSLVAGVLARAGAGAAMAESTARALVLAESQGLGSHGLSRGGQYAVHLATGRVDGAAVPAVTRRKGGAIVVDAASGLAFPACELAVRVNREWGRNPLEIAMIVPYGSYLAREQRMDELPLALVVRSRPESRRARWNRMSKVEGAKGLRETFGDLSSFVRVRLVTAVEAVPRPFTVAWQSDDD